MVNIVSTLKTVTTYGAILGSVLAQLRSAKNMKQSQLAEAIGVVASTWSRIEKGENSLSTEQLRLAAKVLGITAGQILEMTDAVVKEVELQGVKVTDGVGKSMVTGAVAGALIGGMLPLFGPVLGGLVGGVVSSLLNKTEDKQE